MVNEMLPVKEELWSHMTLEKTNPGKILFQRWDASWQSYLCERYYTPTETVKIKEYETLIKNQPRKEFIEVVDELAWPTGEVHCTLHSTSHSDLKRKGDQRVVYNASARADSLLSE